MYLNWSNKLLKINIRAAIILTPAVAMAASGTIVLQGTVESACSISALAATASLGSIETSSSKSITFTYSCNAPFGYTLESLNGGLKLATTVVEYSVTTTLPTDGGTDISDTCTSASIKTGSVTCTFTNSGSAIATAQVGTIDVSWDASNGLVTGNYTDSLVINIEARH